jgi:hypothetical protein
MATYFEPTAYIIGDPNAGFAEIVCQEHARNFAEDNGLTWDNPSTLNYTEERPDQVYAYADYFGELETDTPQSCTACEIDGKHSTYLGVSLTEEGQAYAIENGFPADVIKFYGIETGVICPECETLTFDLRGDLCKDCDKQGVN